MFVQVKKEKEKSLKENGKIELLPKSVRKGLNELKVAIINDESDYEIVYVSHSAVMFPIPIFSCKLMRSGKSLMLLSLKTVENENHNPDEAYIYMFLDWVLKEAMNWVKRFNKERIIITTRLLHCTELFIDNNYDINRISQFDLTGFRATKKYNKGS